MRSTFYTLLLLAAGYLSGYAQNSGKNIFDIARSGSITELNTLTEKDPKAINEIDSRGYTALILACYRGNIPVAMYLIDHADNINHVSSQGTALATMTVHYNKDLTLKLLEKGANANLADQNGETPLFLAVKSGNEELVRILLDHKADVTIKDNQHKTVFEYAVESNDHTIINLLKNKK